MIGGHPVDPFIIEAVCVFLVAFGSLSLLGLCWQWVVSLIASKQYAFGNLHQEIVERRDEIASILDETPSSGKALIYIGRLLELRERLLKLGINTPQKLPNIDKLSESSKEIKEWITFLMMLAPDARAKDLKAARKQD